MIIRFTIVPGGEDVSQMRIGSPLIHPIRLSKLLGATAHLNFHKPL